MKKRNFILDFALKSKYNFFACLVALLVLIFSVSSITYAWIEGATTLTINSPTGNKVFDDNLLAFNITSADDNTNTIKIDPYIDSQVVCLAPATGTVVDNEIQVKFSGRDASTNDISNNYLFFEAKIKCVDLVTGFAFTGDSSIKIGKNTVSGIKTGVTVLNASNRTPIASKITDAPDLPGAIAVDGLTDEQGEYILQFKIWNQTGVDTYNGEEVAVNLTLTTQKAATTIYLKDYTNTSTTDNALNGKTLQIKSGDVVIPIEPTKSADNVTYEFKNVPDKYLENLTFKALDSDKSVYASWSASLLNGVTTYYVYGDPKKSLGTYDGVQQVTFSDASYENLLKIDAQDVTIDNGVALSESSESYVMHKMSDTKYTAYVPVGTSSTPGGSEGKTITFSNGVHSVTAPTFSKSNPYYYIFGATETVNSDATTECIGFWTTSSTVLTDNVLPITIKDYTKTNLNSNGFSVYVSYPDFGTSAGVPYKAYYDAAANAWKINSYYSTLFTTVDKVWSFKATDGTTVHSWTKSSTNTRPDGKTTYTLTSANGISSTGTWDYKDSLIDPAILTGEKVSFYAGFETSWGNTIYINVDSDSGVIRTDSYTGTTETPFLTIDNLNGRNYSAAKFTLPSLEYYISNKDKGWDGKKIGENAQRGKFYGIYGIDDKNQGVETISPVTGATTIGGENGTSSSPVSVPQGSTSVAFATATSGNNSVVGSPLYAEYYICPADSVTDKDAYECLNPYSPTANPKGTVVSSNSANATIDLSAYQQDNTYVIKTVLTDGLVYYVDDTDYITIAPPPSTRKVTLSAVQGGDGTATVTYNGGSIDTAGGNADIAELTDLTITVTPDTSNENYVFDRIEICEGGTVIETINSNSGTYKIPVKTGHPDITIKPYVKVQSKITVYFKNTARWSSPIYAYTWEPKNKEFPGDQMTPVDGETDVYYIELAADTYSNILFTNKADGTNGSQTTNTTIPDVLAEKNMFICDSSAISGGSDNGKYGGTWGKYTPKVYKSVKVTAPEGVTIKATSEGGIDQTVAANTTETFSVEQNKKISLVATPTDNSGYYTYTWTGGNGKTENNAANSTYTTTISGDTTITVALSNHTYKLDYSQASGITSRTEGVTLPADKTSVFVPAGTSVKLQFVDTSKRYNLKWSANDETDSTVDVLEANTVSTYNISMNGDRNVKLVRTQLYKVEYTNNAVLTSCSPNAVKTENGSGDKRISYIPAGANLVLSAITESGKTYTYSWDDGNPGTTSTGAQFPITNLSGDISIKLSLTVVTGRTIILNNDAHAFVTATYEGTTYKLIAGENENVPVGAQIKMTVKTADGIVTGDNAALNGYKFKSITVQEGTGTASTLGVSTTETSESNRIATTTINNDSKDYYEVPVGTSDITITTSAELEKFVLCGEYVGYGNNNWNSYYEMSGEGDPATAVTGTFTAESTTAKFKIVELGSDDSNTSGRRDKPQYSVTINAPTLKVNGEAKTLSDTGDNTHVALNGLTSGKEVTVKYDLAANTIIVTYEVPVVTGRTIYYKNTNLSATATPGIWYWYRDSNREVAYAANAGYEWPGPSMTCVDATNKIFMYKLTGDAAESNYFKFNGDGGTEKILTDAEISANKFMYNYQTSQWEVYNTSGGGTPVDSDYYIVGDFAGGKWGTDSAMRMQYPTQGSDTVEYTVTVSADLNKSFKIYGNSTYYTYNNNSNRTISSTGSYDFSTRGGEGNDAIFNLPAGTYKISFNTSTKRLVIS